MADLDTLKSQALSLDPEARAALADALLESLDLRASEAATQAWLAEVQRRRKAVEGGSVVLLPGDSLFADLNDAG